MEKTLPAEPPAEEAAALYAAIDEYIREIDKLRERMAKSQAEIEASRKRTRAMLAQLKGG